MEEKKNIFEIEKEHLRYDIEGSKKVIKAKLKKEWIKERQQGNAKVSYIGGNTVIHLLNNAFNYQWSYEIVNEEIIESLPKPVVEWKNKKRVPKVDAEGKPVMEHQPPVAKVLGRLTVPGLGIKEQYGSKILIGGATEQESAFKAATTDALKKCASLLGIGLELYGDEEYNFEDYHAKKVSEIEEAPAQAEAKVADTPKEKASEPVKKAPEPVKKVEDESPEEQAGTKEQPVEAEDKPKVKQEKTEAQTSEASTQWQKDDVNRLKELKVILGLTDNNEMNPYTQEFFESDEATYKNLSPANIKEFNKFLTKKVEEV